MKNEVALHGNATTTPRNREYIQKSPKVERKLAKELGVSRDTIRRWKKKESAADGSHTPVNLQTTRDAATETVLVEQAFHFFKNDPGSVSPIQKENGGTRSVHSLQSRPVYHYRADRVRAHVFLCMLAYDVTFELRRRLAPLLYDDEQPATQGDPVAPAEPSESARDLTTRPPNPTMSRRRRCEWPA